MATIDQLTNATVLSRDMNIPVSLFGQNLRISLGQLIDVVTAQPDDVKVQYSSDAKEWHDDFRNGDKWMRFSQDSGKTWGGAISIEAKEGQPGKDGATYYTWIKYSDIANPQYPEDIYDSPKESTTHIGLAFNRSTPEESNNPAVYQWMRMRGIDGNSLTDVGEYYAVGESSKTPPSTGLFIQVPPNDMPQMTRQKPYLWNFERTYFSDGKIVSSEPALIGSMGADGVGIQSVTNYYLASKRKSGVTTSDTEDEKWSTDEADATSRFGNDYPYLWNYEVITYTNMRTQATEPHIIGHWGSTGMTIDVDNEMDMVLCDQEGTVTLGLPVETTVRMWQGTTQLKLDSLTTEQPSGVTVTSDKDTGKVTVTAISASVADKIIIRITAKSGAFEGWANFTIVKSRAPWLYQLGVAPSQIKEGATRGIAVGIRRSNGRKSEEYPLTGSAVTVWWSKDDGAFSRLVLSPIDVSNVTDSVTIHLCEGTAHDTNKLLDSETIPVIRDGKGLTEAEIQDLSEKIASQTEGKVLTQVRDDLQPSMRSDLGFFVLQPNSTNNANITVDYLSKTVTSMSATVASGSFSGLSATIVSTTQYGGTLRVTTGTLPTNGGKGVIRVTANISGKTATLDIPFITAPQFYVDSNNQLIYNGGVISNSLKGKDGINGTNGTNGKDGVNGKDGKKLLECQMSTSMDNIPLSSWIALAGRDSIPNVSNASDFAAGDTAMIRGKISDLGGTECYILATVVANGLNNLGLSNGRLYYGKQGKGVNVVYDKNNGRLTFIPADNPVNTTINDIASKEVVDALEYAVDSNSKDLFYQKETIANHTTQLAQKANTSDVDPWLKKTVDLTGLNSDSFYPVRFKLAKPQFKSRLVVSRPLEASYGVPSYSTHANGFALNVTWESNGFGWGVLTIVRTILSYALKWSNTLVAGNIGQMENSSNEYIYLRGGSKYDVQATNCESITLETSTYSIYNETIQVPLPLSSITAPVMTLDTKVARNDFTWSNLGNKPKVVADLGLGDLNISSGTIHIGSQSITPLTQHQSLSDYYKKSEVYSKGEVDGKGFQTQTQVSNTVKNYVKLTGSTLTVGDQEKNIVTVQDDTDYNLTYLKLTKSNYVNGGVTMQLCSDRQCFLMDYGIRGTFWGQSWSSGGSVSGDLTDVGQITTSGGNKSIGDWGDMSNKSFDKCFLKTQLLISATNNWSANSSNTAGSVINAGSMEFTAATPFIDFHTTATDVSDYDARLILNYSGGASYLRVLGANFTCSGSITQNTTSDIRLKTDLTQDDYLAIIRRLGNVVNFRYKPEAKMVNRSLDIDRRHTGLVYQNASLADIPDFTGTDDKGYGYINFLSSDYQATLLGATKEVDRKVTNHDTLLNQLLMRMAKIEEENLELKKRLDELEKREA